MFGTSTYQLALSFEGCHLILTPHIEGLFVFLAVESEALEK